MVYFNWEDYFSQEIIGKIFLFSLQVALMSNKYE